MRAWDRLKAAYRALTFADFPWIREQLLLDGPASAGVVVTHKTALEHSPVWKAGNVISGEIAATDRYPYRRLPDGGREKATSHPTFRLLSVEPNSFMTPLTFWQTLMFHVLFWGNGYAEIEWDRALRPIGLWPILPDQLAPELVEGALFYRYRGGKLIPQEDIFHIPGLGFDGLKGYSVISLARKSLALGIAAERYGATFFGNGAWPGVVAEHPNTLSVPAQERLRASWNQLHQGPDKAHRLAVLEEGMTIKKIGIPPDDAQFLETRQFQIEEVARWFNVPPHKLGHEVNARPGGNLEESDLEFRSECLRPWFIRIEQECNRKLFPPSQRGTFYVEHSVNQMLRLNYKAKNESYALGRQWGWLSANDVRMKENEPGIGRDGDIYLQPANMVPAGTSPPPAPVAIPAAQPAEAVSAQRALLIDVIARFVRREGAAARRAAKRGPIKFREWIEDFYGREISTLQLSIQPAVAWRLALCGGRASEAAGAALALAEAYVLRSKEELLALKVTDIEDRVDHLMERWELIRPVEMADQIAALEAKEETGVGASVGA